MTGFRLPSPHVLHSVLVQMISDLLSIAKSHATNSHFLHTDAENEPGPCWVGQRIVALLRCTTVEPGITVLV